MKLKLSHIGMVVDKVSELVRFFQAIGFKEITDPEPDPIQKVSARFVTVGDEQRLHVELLEATQEDSPVFSFLKKRGGGLHHLCFEVADIEKTADELAQNGFRMVSKPVECIGYDRSFKDSCGRGTKVAFFLIDHLLIELLEKGGQM